MKSFQQLQESSITEASTELEQVLVHHLGGETKKDTFSKVAKVMDSSFESTDELASTIIKNANFSGSVKPARMSVNDNLRDDKVFTWKGTNNTSKTDIHLGNYDVSLKSGSAAIMSGGNLETISTYEAALKHAESSFSGELDNISKDIQKAFEDMMPNTTGEMPGGLIAQQKGSLPPHKASLSSSSKRKMAMVGERNVSKLKPDLKKRIVSYDKSKKPGAKVKKGFKYYAILTTKKDKDDISFGDYLSPNARTLPKKYTEFEYKNKHHIMHVEQGDDGKDEIMTKANTAHKQIQDKVAKLFEGSEDFKKAFVYEAMTGKYKFKEGSDNCATSFLIAEFNGNAKLVTPIKDYNDAYVEEITKKVKPVVRFKATSQKTTLKGDEQKTGFYNFWSVLQLNYNHLKEEYRIMEEEKQKMNLLLAEEKITEMAFFNWIKNKLKSIAKFIKNTIKKVKDFIMNKVDNIIEFMDLKPEINFNNNISW